MGMEAESFWNMSPREFRAKQKGYTQRAEREHRSAWEVARWQTCWQINSQMAEADRKSPAAMFPLPWDAKPVTAVPQTQEDRKAYFERLKKKYSK
jgi:hypothetical protein